MYTYSSPDHGETVVARECALFPGYYHYPAFNNLAVSPDGDVIDLLTRRQVPPHVLGDPEVDPLFVKVVVEINDNGEPLAFDLARVVAQTFVARQKGQLEINIAGLHLVHLDGDPTNCKSDNLKWFTHDGLVQYYKTHHGKTGQDVQDGFSIS